MQQTQDVILNIGSMLGQCCYRMHNKVDVYTHAEHVVVLCHCLVGDVLIIKFVFFVTGRAALNIVLQFQQNIADNYLLRFKIIIILGCLKIKLIFSYNVL